MRAAARLRNRRARRAEALLTELLHFATPHPADGRALRHWFDEFILEWLPKVAAALAERPGMRVAAGFVPPSLLGLYIEQALYVELLDVVRTVFRARFEQRGTAVSVPIELADVLRATQPGPAVALAASRTLTAPSARAALRQAIRKAANRVYRATPPSHVPGTVAVELVEGADPGRKSDAFWAAADGIDPHRILYVLEPINITLVDVERNLDAVRRSGSRIVALDPRMTAGGRIPYWRPGALPQWTKDLRAALPRAELPMDRWINRHLKALAERAGYWQAFYQDHGVLAVQQFTELSTEGPVKRIAIDRAGGIEIGKMRSQFFERASAAFHFQHEVAFVWHRDVERYLRAGRTRTRVLVDSGYVYGYLKQTFTDEARTLRAQFASGVAVVLAVFDNFPHVNGHFHSNQLLAFYEVVFKLAQRHSWLGLVVKSKKPTILRTIGSLHGSLQSLKAARRCVVLDEALTSVLPAAMASDLALGFPSSTAACEAALGGCKVLMYDPGRASDHPWVDPSLGIILHELKAFEECATNAIEAMAAGAPSGMSPEFLIQIDRHQDSGAPRRAWRFLDGFLGARLAGCTKEESIGKAIENCAAFAWQLEEA